MTFSIVGRCRRTGMFGVAATTSSIAVGARCPWARAKIGAVASQNVTDPALGPAILDQMAAGKSAADSVAAVVDNQPHIEHRQLIAVDAAGGAGHYSGAKTLGRHAVEPGHDCVAAGNLLSTGDVPKAMVQTFEADIELHLAARLVDALEAGFAIGGEEGPVRSAAVLVVHDLDWPLVDLRVDWDDRPVARLRTIWQSYQPQMQDYLTRALDPDSAPAFGVPGDEDE
ncbi:MAG: DUF1028 domain-containing protein [Alphaproteobacteria bacterium]|nr:DUF1028 domain-containing protein [Alphaproteobacteria bacterium]